jgi:hypothetical protein
MILPRIARLGVAVHVLPLLVQESVIGLGVGVALERGTRGLEIRPSAAISSGAM